MRERYKSLEFHDKRNLTSFHPKSNQEMIFFTSVFLRMAFTFVSFYTMYLLVLLFKISIISPVYQVWTKIIFDLDCCFYHE